MVLLLMMVALAKLRRMRPNPTFVPYLRPSPAYIIDVRVQMSSDYAINIPILAQYPNM